MLNDDFSIKTNKSALNGDAKIILDGSKKTSVVLKGSGVATVVTDSDGQLVVNSPDPNTILEHITNNEIDIMMGKIVVPDEDKSVTIDPSLSNPGQVADAKTTGDAIREEVERAKKVENEIKNDVNNRFVSQNILVGTETGNPISVDDAFSAPLCGLTVYGKSTQDGTPTPDAPVPIVSAGESGSVAVKVTGKNLLDFLHAEITKNGWAGTFTRDEEILTVSAVNGWTSYWFVSPVRGKQISVSFTYRQIDDKTGDTTQGLAVGTSNKPSYMDHDVYQIESPKKSWTKIACTMISEAYIGMMLRVENEGVNEKRTIEIKDFQLELGTTATAYSPYREQLLTLPTPNGLPGIPVTSGGNYTDPQGQQWVCDEVDLERGVKVQWVKVKELSPDDKWAYRKTNRGNNNFQLRIYNADIAAIRKSCFCNILRYTGNGWDDISQNLPKIYANDQEITVSYPPNSEYSSLEVFKQLLTNVKSVIYYALATPIETPLTPDEIAYKAITAYGPDTVVQAGDGAGVKLEYQRDVNLVVKKLEDAIASIT